MEKRSLEYNGRNYLIVLPPVENCIILANRVAVLMGGTLATLQSNDMGSFSKALSSVDPVATYKLMVDATKEAKLHCEQEFLGNSSGFEKHFGQHRKDVYPVCFWVIWQCVCDFLPESLGAFTQGLPDQVQKEFQSLMDGKSTGGLDGRSGISFALGKKSQPAK